jgi:hypothetical protein
MKYIRRERFFTSEALKVFGAFGVFIYFGEWQHEMDFAIAALLVAIYAELLTIVRNTKKNESQAHAAEDGRRAA